MTTLPSSGPAWDDSCSVGVPELDDQHRNLFRVLAELAAALSVGGDPAAVSLGLKDLLEDSSTHFETEEAFLEGVGYPETVQQRVQHRLFVQRLSALLGRVRAGEERFGEATLENLASWLRGHILGLDREYAEYLRRRER